MREWFFKLENLHQILTYVFSWTIWHKYFGSELGIHTYSQSRLLQPLKSFMCFLVEVSHLQTGGRVPEKSYCKSYCTFTPKDIAMCHNLFCYPNIIERSDYQMYALKVCCDIIVSWNSRRIMNLEQPVFTGEILPNSEITNLKKKWILRFLVTKSEGKKG